MNTYFFLAFICWLCVTSVSQNPYYFIYGTVGIIAFFSFNKKINQNTKPVFYILLLYLMIIGGGQYEIKDYANYRWLYEKALDFQLSMPSAHLPGKGTIEVGYVVISQIARLLFLPYPAFFFLLCLLTIGIKLIILKKYSPFLNLSLFLYVSLIFMKDITQMRGNIAASLVFVSFIYLVKNKFVHFFFINLFASSIHTLAITAIPIYWLIKLPLRYMAALLMSALTWSLLFGGFSRNLTPLLIEISESFAILSRAASKLERAWAPGSLVSEVNIGLGILFIAFVFLMGALKYNRFGLYQRTCLVSLWYGMISFVLFRDYALVAHRFLEMYTTFALVIVLPQLVFSTSNKGFRGFIWVISFAYGVFNSYSVIFASNTPEYQNYFVIWLETNYF